MITDDDLDEMEAFAKPGNKVSDAVLRQICFRRGEEILLLISELRELRKKPTKPGTTLYSYRLDDLESDFQTRLNISLASEDGHRFYRHALLAIRELKRRRATENNEDDEVSRMIRWLGVEVKEVQITADQPFNRKTLHKIAALVGIQNKLKELHGNI